MCALQIQSTLCLSIATLSPPEQTPASGIKMGSEESHSDVSLTKSQDCSGKRAEADSNRGPSAAYQPNALPLLAQTGSHSKLMARLVMMMN